VDLQEYYARVYLLAGAHHGVTGNYFIQVEGWLTADTSAPGVLAETTFPDTVHVGDSLRFVTLAMDDDTLAEVRVIISPIQGNTLRIPMQRLDGDTFRVSWMVPDENLYSYRFEAEDFWENVATYPDTGWLQFHTTGWSAADPRLTAHPSSLIVQVYPNPSNGWPSIKIAPEWFAHGAVTVSVYNVLGQKVWEQMVVNSRGIQQFARTVETSGVYLLKVSNRQHSALQKFVILK
jgi:hypothetical protein